jgi:hypothetical protein
MEGLKAMATACGYNCYMVSSSKNMGDMKQLKQNVYKLLKD